MLWLLSSWTWGLFSCGTLSKVFVLNAVFKPSSFLSLIWISRKPRYILRVLGRLCFPFSFDESLMYEQRRPFQASFSALIESWCLNIRCIERDLALRSTSVMAVEHHSWSDLVCYQKPHFIWVTVWSDFQFITKQLSQVQLNLHWTLCWIWRAIKAFSFLMSLRAVQKWMYASKCLNWRWLQLKAPRILEKLGKSESLEAVCILFLKQYHWSYYLIFIAPILGKHQATLDLCGLKSIKARFNSFLVSEFRSGYWL